MDKPHIADKKPRMVKLFPGTYYVCRCGLSQNQPFCDGHHCGTPFVPEEIVTEQTIFVNFCLCKQSLKGSVCDGAHLKL